MCIPFLLLTCLLSVYFIDRAVKPGVVEGSLYAPTGWEGGLARGVEVIPLETSRMRGILPQLTCQGDDIYQGWEIWNFIKYPE